MNTKRFVQLFICYAVSIVFAMMVTNLFHFSNQLLYMIMVSIIGYIVLTIPLTIMTIRKNKRL